MAGFRWTKGKRGDWLVSGPSGSEGEVVTVTKKSGATSEVFLTRSIWSKGGRALYTVERARPAGLRGRAALSTVPEDPEAYEARRERAREDAEYAKGVADAET